MEHLDHPLSASGPAGPTQSGPDSGQGPSPQGPSRQGLSRRCPRQGLSRQGLSRQGLSPQGLSPQGLSPQGLSPQGLSPQGLSRQSLSRRAVLAGGVGVSAAVAAGWRASASAAPTGPAGGPTAWAHRAERSYHALQEYFRDDRTGFYLETYPRDGGNAWSYVWPFSQAMVATQLMAGIPGVGARYRGAVADRFRALEAYWNDQTDPQGYDSYLRPPNGQGGDKFYDDNEWIGLSFLLRNAMSRHGDAAAVRRAAAIFDLVTYGWDTDPSHPLPGGVFWTQAPWSSDRNTVSNAPGAEIGARLYLLTGRRSYLDWATRMYDWVRGSMLAPNGLYFDHVNLAGTIEKTQWSYNQGVMIGAGALLYRATGRREYLDQARSTAAAALAYYGSDDRYTAQGAAFNAIFFANLLQLSTISRDRAYRRTMEAYADDARARFRDPSTGLYRFHGDQPVELLQQSGMVRIEAMLAWRPGHYRKLT